MKIFNKFLYLAATALALVAVSCVPKEEPVEVGPQDVEGCFDVFFPAQDASGSHILSPSDALEIEITISRTVSEGEITVPIIAEFSEDGIFTFDPVTFADGQAETTFKVKFPEVGNNQGVVYDAHLRIDDPKYASYYTETAKGIDFSVMQVEMKYFMNPVTNEKAKIHWVQGWWGEEVDGYLQYYEVDGVRTCFTESISDTHYYNGYYDGPGFWGGTDVEWSFIWFTKNNFIRIPPTNTGYHHSSYDADVYALDYFYYNTGSEDNAEFLDWAAKNTDVVSYYDGNGGFYFSIRSYYMFGIGGWSTDPFETFGISEGFTRVDYSFEVESDFSSGGVAPIYITAGADVASVKYQIYEGSLNAAQVGNKANELAEGAEAVTLTDELVLDEDDNMKYAAIGVSPEKSGTYTFVAIVLDDKGEVQNSGSTVFQCITAEDEPEFLVDVNVFTEDTPARYQNLHDYDSFAYCIYGTDLVEVHLGIFSEATISTYGADYVMNVVKADADHYMLLEEDLEMVNKNGGMYDVISKLAGNTKYYVIVWATNGALEKFVYAAYTTAKLPYVWNSLGTGELTDGFYNGLFTGKTDYVGPCEVYEEANTPGLYMITGFQCADVAHFFGMEPEEMLPYEGGNWKNTEIVIDATDPNAVFIEEQDWGICVNSSYGFILIETEDSGTLVDGVISWPAEEVYVGLPGLGKWYYGNSEGTFKIVLPSAVTAGAPAKQNVGCGVVKDTEIAPRARFSRNTEKVVYERDAQPVKNVKATVLENNVRPASRKHTDNKLNVL